MTDKTAKRQDMIRKNGKAKNMIQDRLTDQTEMRQDRRSDKMVRHRHERRKINRLNGKETRQMIKQKGKAKTS